MKKLTLIILGLFAMLFMSCTMTYKINKCKKWGVCKTDTVEITHIEEIKDTVVILDKSETYLDLFLECDSLGEVFIRSINELKTENNLLKFKLKDGQMVVYVEVPKEEIKIKYKVITRTEREVVTNLVKHKSKFQNFKTWWFWITAILALSYIAYRVKRIF